MKKILVTIILSFIFIFPSGVGAVTTISRSDIPIDETLSDLSQDKIVAPKNIVISRVYTSNNEYSQNSKLWVQSLYYFAVTRLGFLDLPYTYLVDRDGKVYEGKKGGVYTDPHTQTQKGTIVIGYLSNEDDITSFANISIKQIISDNSKRNGIPRKNVSVNEVALLAVENGVSKLVTNPDNSDFARNMNSNLNTVTYSSKPNIKYSAEVKEISYNKEVKSTEKFTVTVAFENKDNFPWFSASEYIYLSTKGSQESPFAVNGKWESFSKPLLISDKTIMPGEELKLEFEMQAKLLPGSYTQSFNLLTLPNNVFSGSQFNVAFKVLKGDFKLVKIVGIPSLNVRSCIGPKCPVITQVGENQIFVMEEKNAGWYRIKYLEKKSGWVFGQYVEEL